MKDRAAAVCGLTGKFIKTWVAFPQISGKQAAPAASHLADRRTAISGDPTGAATEDARTLIAVQGESCRPKVPEGDTLEPVSQKEICRRT